jgi:hypothetical protein
MESKMPNIDTLRQLYNDSPVARAFFDHAARRERDQSETKVDRILVRLRADGHEFRRREIIDLFRKMQDQGLGQFVEGRHGWPSRFVWSTGLTSVGRAAIGERQIIEHISSEDGAVDGNQKDPDRTQVDRSSQREEFEEEELGESLTGRDLDYGVALALAYAGDANRAQSLADDLGKRFPEDTSLQFNYLPTLRAKLALLRANPQQALDILKIAAPYELGLAAASIYNWPNLYPVYVRGEAYLAAHKGNEAAAEFQKILDHRGIVSNAPIGALAHLQLGRAYTLQGDTAKSHVAYQNFLTLWKDADADIPILKKAKAEYANLQINTNQLLGLCFANPMCVNCS